MCTWCYLKQEFCIKLGITTIQFIGHNTIKLYFASFIEG